MEQYHLNTERIELTMAVPTHNNGSFTVPTDCTSGSVQDNELFSITEDAAVTSSPSESLPSVNQNLTHSYRKVVYVVFSEDSEHWTITILIPFLIILNIKVLTLSSEAIPGSPLISMMRELINKSDKLILIISKLSIKEMFFLYNIDYALHKDPTGMSIIPVLYENATHSDIPKQVLHLISISNNDPEFANKITSSVYL